MVFLLLAAPVFLGIMIALMPQAGSIFFVHRRVGLAGRMFGCMKFRTMRVNADEMLAQLLRDDASAREEWQATRKLRRDPRVTWIGRLLRQTSLDELPQLLNVLNGTMSMVGPRPVVPDELAQHYGSQAAAAYLSVRPGITGLWQVSGRSDADYDRRIALDCAYVANMSTAGDIRLMLRTVIVLLRRDGAY